MLRVDRATLVPFGEEELRALIRSKGLKSILPDANKAWIHCTESWHWNRQGRRKDTLVQSLSVTPVKRGIFCRWTICLVFYRDKHRNVPSRLAWRMIWSVRFVCIVSVDITLSGQIIIRNFRLNQHQIPKTAVIRYIFSECSQKSAFFRILIQKNSKKHFSYRLKWALANICLFLRRIDFVGERIAACVVL